MFTLKVLSFSVLAVCAASVAAGAEAVSPWGAAVIAQPQAGDEDDDKAAKKTKPVKEKLLVLEAAAGAEDSIFGEAGYKVTRIGKLTIKEFEVEVNNAPKGSKHPVRVDGFEAGWMTVDMDGEGDLELMETDELYFPEGFPVVKEGSIVEVGDLLRFELLTMTREVDIQGEHRTDAGFVAEAKFKVERVGKRISKQLKFEIEGGKQGDTFAVTLDGVKIVDLLLDVEGAAKVKMGFGENPFPKGFVDPKVGSVVRFGDSIEIVLEQDD